jgi:hypothetical protein
MRTVLLVLAATLPLLACGGGPPASRAAKPDSARSSSSASAPSGTAAAGGEAVSAAAEADPGDGEMTGALGVPFGATRDAIIAKLGRPEFEQEGFEGVQSMGFPVTVMEQQSRVIFALDRQHGMMRAMIMAQVQDAGQCTMVLALWQHGLEQKYGPARPNRMNGQDPQAGCEAFAAQSRPWGQLWKDEDSGRRILLSLMPGNPAVTITYDTPEADAWERRKNASQL